MGAGEEVTETYRCDMCRNFVEVEGVVRGESVCCGEPMKVMK
jgi:desulfoferrodoxin-like iron-binding protein